MSSTVSPPTGQLRATLTCSAAPLLPNWNFGGQLWVCSATCALCRVVGFGVCARWAREARGLGACSACVSAPPGGRHASTWRARSLAPAGRRGHTLPAREPVRPSRKDDRSIGVQRYNAAGKLTSLAMEGQYFGCLLVPRYSPLSVADTLPMNYPTCLWNVRGTCSCSYAVSVPPSGDRSCPR